MLEPWRQYQEDTAEFFRSLGLEADTDQVVEGARGKHAVDVVVRPRTLGLPQLWIVECKLWEKRVTKEKVLALRSIVEDVGADRGLLLSESGFQAGAIRSSGQTNITLTSLRDLLENVEVERTELKIQACVVQATKMIDRIDRLSVAQRGPGRSVRIAAIAGTDLMVLTGLLGVTHSVQSGMTAAMAGGEPFFLNASGERCGGFPSNAAAVEKAVGVLAEVEQLLIAQEHAVRTAATPATAGIDDG